MFAVMVAGDTGGGCIARVEAVQGVVFNCVGRGSEERAIRGWGTAAQSS